MPDCETGYLTAMRQAGEAPVTNEDPAKSNQATFGSLAANCGRYKYLGAKQSIG
jgi:hypothetical protein